MKELVVFLARYLVNNPDAVEVKETQGDTASVLELKVASSSGRSPRTKYVEICAGATSATVATNTMHARIIGKQGRTAKSIRTILNAAASRTNRKVVLEIVEDK